MAAGPWGNLAVDLQALHRQKDGVEGPTDEHLLSAWQGGDAGAGAELFDRYYEGLSRFFRNKVDDAHCDDIIQQTFLAAPSASFDGRSSVRTWLFSIGWRRLLDHFRRQARRAKYEVGGIEELSVVDLGATPETRYVRRQERRLLLEGLRRLPLRQQVTLELHYWEEMSAMRIAEVLGIPVGTAKTRLRDGRLRLTRVLQEIAESQEVLKSTLDDLDGWARRTRDLAPE
jgi:RNA polymerase sigma-70 factor (ECF subfamily)